MVRAAQIVALAGLGALGLRNEGWFDSYQLLQAFRRKARSLGVVYREEKVVEVEREGSRVTAVRIGNGRARLAAPHPAVQYRPHAAAKAAE